MVKKSIIGATCACALTCNVHAGLITFEDLSGVPVGTVVFDQYTCGGGT